MIHSALKARFRLTRTAKLRRNWHAGGIETTLFFARWLISVLTLCLISPSLADHIDFLPEILEPPRAPIQSPHTLNVRMRVDRRRGEAAMAARHAWSGMCSRESEEGQVDDGDAARMERDLLPRICGGDGGGAPPTSRSRHDAAPGSSRAPPTPSPETRTPRRARSSAGA